MTRELRVALVGLVLLTPAILLVGSGVLGLERPDALVHPVLVMGGVLGAVVLNALSVLRVHVEYEQGALVGTMSLRMRGAAINLVALGLSGLLLASIVLYLFLENFQPR
jgi:hypothetical protein